MDEALVEAAAGGDRDAFAALIEPRFALLYGFASLILIDRGSIDDAVQEALIRAWRDLPQLRVRASFDAWLRRLVVNAAHDEDRRARRHGSVRAPIADDMRIEDSQGRLALEDEVARAFRRLTANERAVIGLRFYLGLSTVETAAILGTSPGAARVRLHRAIRSLASAHKTDGGPFPVQTEAQP